MRKTVSLLLVLVLALANMPIVTAEASSSSYGQRGVSSGTCGNNLTWTLVYDNDSSYGVLTISGTGEMYDYAWSSYLGTVAPWQEAYLLIDRIIVEQGVTSIGNCAFNNCREAVEVDIPNSVTRIGDGAFTACEALVSLDIHAGITSIGEQVFGQCSSLTAINVASNNLYYRSVDGVLYNKAMTRLIRCPEGRNTESYTVPNSVTIIDKEAFMLCYSLRNITLPEGLITIGDSAFYHCINLADVTIPNTVQSIEEGAFLACDQFEEVIIPDSVTYIGNGAFSQCTSLKSVTIGSGLRALGGWPFGYNRSLESATFLGAPPEEYGMNLFNQCAADFCIYYTAAHASEWAPNGESEWNGYPIQMIGAPLTPGDVDGDVLVTFTDISVLYGFLLGKNGIDPLYIGNADFDGDGSATFNDVGAMYYFCLGGN